MSRYKYIRLMFTLTTILFYYIVAAVILNAFGKVTLAYWDFIFVGVLGAIMQFLEYKDVKPYVIMISLISVNMLGFYMIYGLNDFIPYFIFGLVTLCMSSRNSIESINYDYYHSKFKNMIIILLSTIVFYPKMEGSYLKELFKFYIFFIMLFIITLRNSRKFVHKIPAKKKDNVFNVSIIVMILMLSTDFIFNPFTKVFKFILGIFNKIIYWIAWMIFMVLFKPIEAFARVLRSAFQKLNWPAPPGAEDVFKDIKPEEQANIYSVPVIRYVLEAIIVFVIIFIIYRAIKIYRYNKIVKQDEAEEIHEKIKIDKNPSEKKFAGGIKEIFKSKTSREKIFNAYRDFENRTFKKGIFKRYMTAKQLSSVTKSYIDSKEELKYIEYKYNEAKFSKHPIEEKDVKEFKDNYSKVKEKL